MAEEKEAECVFCKIVKGEIKVDFIYENDNFVAFADANPKVDGHTLVVPKRHFVNLMDMPESLGSEMLDAIKHVFEIRSKEGAEGFNVVGNNFPAAGQLVMHAHLHILPRKTADTWKMGV
jgi:histidine triad (HIT) family protein